MVLLKGKTVLIASVLTLTTSSQVLTVLVDVIYPQYIRIYDVNC
jgi:hypothetical protein